MDLIVSHLPSEAVRRWVGLIRQTVKAVFNTLANKGDSKCIALANKINRSVYQHNPYRFDLYTAS